MEVTIRQEAGYDLALYGMSLSFKDRAINPLSWWYFFNDGDHAGLENTDDSDWFPEYWPQVQRAVKMAKVATQNANRGLGHNKFRRQVMLWIDIEAPRFWWSEFDTYKVGTVAQSESTMHTLKKRDLTQEDFEDGVEQFYLDFINDHRESYSIEALKSFLPEAYLQRRLVTLNYEVLSTIINQRKNHRLPQWSTFIKAIYEQCEHPEILPVYPYEVTNE